MSTQRLPRTDETIYTVSQWKEELDKSEPWWRRAYYHFLYCPFNEFSLKVVKVPRPTETQIDGRKVTFRIWEVQGHFGSAHEADIACLTERYCYKEYPFGRAMTEESGQYGNGPVFPRAKNPTKRVRPILSMAITPQQRLTQLETEIANLRQAIQR